MLFQQALRRAGASHGQRHGTAPILCGRPGRAAPSPPPRSGRNGSGGGSKYREKQSSDIPLVRQVFSLYYGANQSSRGASRSCLRHKGRSRWPAMEVHLNASSAASALDFCLSPWVLPGRTSRQAGDSSAFRRLLQGDFQKSSAKAEIDQFSWAFFLYSAAALPERSIFTLAQVSPLKVTGG